jgi:uncharacterized membrane protein YtjA (UPF0391 family)
MITPKIRVLNHMERILKTRKGPDMLRWSFGFLVLALVAAIFGFGGVAAGAADAAKLLFALFAVAWLVSLVFGLVTGRGTKHLT